MKNVFQPLTKSVLIPLGIATAADKKKQSQIAKKNIGLGHRWDLSTLAASLLGRILAGKSAAVTRQGRGVIRAGKGTN